jgi:hypothetical protein
MTLNYDVAILTKRISDHFPFVTFTCANKRDIKKTECTIRDLSDTNIARFKDTLSRLSWDTVTNDPNPDSAFTNFLDTFKDIHNLHFQPRTVKFNKNLHKIEPWLTKGILTSRRNKLNLEKQHARNPTVENWNLFKNYRNLYNKVIRTSKKQYYNEALINNSKNLKKTWAILNEVLKKSQNKQPITSIFHNNTLISDPKIMAETFNRFFTTIADEIASLINPTMTPNNDTDDRTYTQTEDTIDNNDIKFNMSGIPVTSDEIITCINQLEDKKTPDMTGITTNLLKQIQHSILVPLRHVFTQSLALGVVPHKLKIAKIIPIFKSGDASDINNYRPISLLSSFSKILEKIVQTRLTNYLNAHNLITPQQFGFRSGHSTLHPMTLLLNKVTKALNDKKHSIIIFCDLKKAFDTCNHSILLKKLQRLGIRDTELEWFKSYLTDRKQFVTIDSIDSTLLTILTGVPQGSILGPLLFLLYINDLPSCTKLFSLLFADDTALTASHENIDTLFDYVNTEFRKLCHYFRLNKLSLHPDKTKYLLISPSTSNDCNRRLLINNNNNDQDNPLNIHELQRVKCSDKIPAIKYLGVYFDPNLNFKYHISQISKKLSHALYSLRSAKHIFSEKYLRTLYFSIFHCHLTYAIEIWSSTNPSFLKPLLTKQKAAIRIISNKRYNDHTEPLFKALSILPLNDLVTHANLKLFHSYVYNYIPNAFANIWITNRQNRDNDDLQLRNDNEYFVPRFRTDFIARLPLFNLPKIWNETPNTLTSTSHKHTFNTQAFKYFLEQLNATPNCNRLVCPACITNNLQI